MCKILVLILMASSWSVFGQTLTTLQTDSVMELIDARVKSTKTQSVDFKLVKNIKGLAKPIEQEGNLFFQNPNQLRYIMEGDRPWKMVVNGKDVYTKSGDEKVKKSGFAMKKVTDFILQSLNGESLKSKEFSKSFVLVDGQLKVVLKPEVAILKKYVAEITISFNNVYDVTNFVISQPNGNTTRYSFSNLKRNIVLKQSLFSLK